MKNILFGLLVLSTIMGYGQDEPRTERDEIKTIFSKGTKISGYGAFDMAFTNMNASNTLLLGGHGGIIFNRSFLLGFSGMGIATGNEFQDPNFSQKLKLSGGYGGLLLGYIFAPNEIFHLSFPLTLGMGSLDVVNAEYRFGSIPIQDQINNGWILDSSIFLMVEPSAQVEINITKFFRLGVGASYRFTEGLDLLNSNIGDNEVSGFSGNLSFKFGYF